MADFKPALALVLQHESGFQKDPNDAGNWTGGEVGKGELRGTKYGISARSYPAEDIENLTEERAGELYEKDYWAYGYGRINDQNIANKLLDMAVNMERYGGHGRAVKILQKAIVACKLPIAVDGVFGDRTVISANNLQPGILLPEIRRQEALEYAAIALENPKELRYLPGWIVRSQS